MNQNIQAITLNLDPNVPWYTISLATTIEGRYIKQSSGINSFAIVTLKIEPYPERESIIFDNQIANIDMGCKVLDTQKNPDRHTLVIVNTICQGICKGIETACLDLEQKKYILIGIKVIAIAAKYHLVDSRSRCYQLATHSALLEALQ